MQIHKWDVDRLIKSEIKNGEYMSTLLEAGAFNFTVRASDYALDKFQKSFEDGGFYKQGRWAKRKHNYSHSIMHETGDLMSLKKSKVYTRKGSYKRVKISTTERYGRRRGKKQIGYGAVHNDPTGYHVNQYSSTTPVRRQFMGHNQQLYNEIRSSFESLIFSKMNNI